MSEIELVCAELGPPLELLRRSGFRLDVIYPADDPHTAVLSKDGETIRLTSRPESSDLQSELPAFRSELLVSRDGGGSGEGRAGMLYRDLIPGRLGGRFIASHITIPEAGEVPDWVHYHRVALQFIYVREGWVRVVYEDQGEPFVMQKGDLVLQPPEIRHRVLESSGGLEVIEIGCPAVHATYADHEIALPNGCLDPSRKFSGQRFLRHIASETAWTPFLTGEAQETGIHEATAGIAQVRTIRSNGSDLAFPPHNGELVFGFVLEGSGRLDCRGSQDLHRSDAIVIPPSERWSICEPSGDFRMLHVVTAGLD